MLHVMKLVTFDKFAIFFSWFYPGEIREGKHVFVLFQRHVLDEK